MMTIIPLTAAGTGLFWKISSFLNSPPSSGGGENGRNAKEFAHTEAAMTQPLEALQAETPVAGNVRELRPTLDRTAAPQPGPVAAAPTGRRARLR
ncbi:hypothetical protein, partial [Klebsiella pneumoniae]|uniref:hypothetical protein n=1 Tax=Klebsiella pneumoniae TaxID=573 RepID=UPI003721A104